MRFYPDLIIREVELARGVAARARVVALDRSDSRAWETPRLSARLRLRWDMARGGWASWDGGDFERFRMPVIMGTGILTNRLAARVNEHQIVRAVERFGCDTVFHSNPFLFLPPPRARRSYRVHFDLVDNFFDGWRDNVSGRARKRFLRDMMLRADSLSTISHALCDRVEEFTGRRPAYVPNGAAVAQIRAWPAQRARDVRSRLGLENRRVLAYIGNHVADFDGTDMLMEGFLKARAVRKDLALILVGRGADRVPRARGLGVAEGVHVVGPVPTAEVWDYFHAADLGLLPFVLEPGTHHCLPLKVLEFAAAGKPMLASPLHELQRLRLPHLRFAPYDSDAWCRSLLDEATYLPPDRTETDVALRPFSWDAASRALVDAMSSQ